MSPINISIIMWDYWNWSSLSWLHHLLQTKLPHPTWRPPPMYYVYTHPPTLQYNIIMYTHLYFPGLVYTQNNTTLLCINIYIIQGWCTPTHPPLYNTSFLCIHIYIFQGWCTNTHPPLYNTTLLCIHIYIFQGWCSRGTNAPTTSPIRPGNAL